MNKIVFSAIAGGLATNVNFLLQFLTSTLNIGNYDPLDFSSRLFLNTTEGSPDLLGLFFVNLVSGIIYGIIFGLIIFLSMRFAGWERELTRYLLIAIIFGVIVWLLFLPLVIGTNFDLVIDGSMQLIITLIGIIILALILYFLEDRFG